jgi:AcrR family transcriptional regulator
MGLLYHESMTTPYEATGRQNQKSRTRAALVAAARAMLADGESPSVEGAARAAGISRTTAYRYFPTVDALVAAAHPEIELSSLLEEDAPADVRERLDRVLDEHFRVVREWEPQLRASLAASVRPGAAPQVLRQGRAIGWIADALRPLRDGRSAAEVRQIAVRIRAVAGIESFVWLVDVAGLSRRRALVVMRQNVHAVLDDVLTRD